MAIQIIAITIMHWFIDVGITFAITSGIISTTIGIPLEMAVYVFVRLPRKPAVVRGASGSDTISLSLSISLSLYTCIYVCVYI